MLARRFIRDPDSWAPFESKHLIGQGRSHGGSSRARKTQVSYLGRVTRQAVGISLADLQALRPRFSVETSSISFSSMPLIAPLSPLVMFLLSFVVSVVSTTCTGIGGGLWGRIRGDEEGARKYTNCYTQEIANDVGRKEGGCRGGCQRTRICRGDFTRCETCLEGGRWVDSAS